MNRTVFVSELSYDLVQEDLESHFSKSGPIKALFMFMDRRGWFTGQAKIEFETEEGYLDALKRSGDLLMERGMAVVPARDPIVVREKPAYKKEDPEIAPGTTKTVHVSHVDWSSTSEQIKEIFAPYGNIVTIRIPQNLNEVAFVTFDNEDSVERAIIELQGTDLCGRQLRLARGDSKPWDEVAPGSSKTAFISGLPNDIEEGTLTDSLGHFGEIESIRIKRSEKAAKRTIAFVCFNNTAAVERIMTAYESDGVSVGNELVFVSRAKERKEKRKAEPSEKQISSDTLYIKNFPEKATLQDFRRAFEKYGKIQSVAIPTDLKTGKPRGFAFVFFDKLSAAEAAFASRSNITIGGARLWISYRSVDKKRKVINKRAL